MNRTIKAIIGVVFILTITFSAISICQNIGRYLKLDVTDQKLYTLSKGTKSILAKLNQPIKMKLYYAKTAALKGPDQIRYFNNYYQFVKSLLEEYSLAAKGMIDLQIIDPRPFSEDEIQALGHGLKKFPITQEENFFFGLVVQTQFGVEKTIPFFSPDRQNFIEYDVSYLIDTAITRQKKNVGIISSLPVMGEDVSGYMAQMMRMQGQRPKPAWTFVEQLREQYEVKQIPTDTNEIKDIDTLLVIHPKNLAEETLFAIDQFILKGGRAIICIDPHCIADPVKQQSMYMATATSQSSNLEPLLKTWGLEMPEKTFAGDRNLAMIAPLQKNRRPEKVIGYLNLTSTSKCFNSQSAITASLNEVRMIFAGVLNEIADSNTQQKDSSIQRTPLLMTTNRGNTWSISSPYDLMFDLPKLMDKFVGGTEPVMMGYMITGKLESSFPEGIEIEVDDPNEKTDSDKKGSSEESKDEKKKITKRITGLTKAQQDCAVLVFSDVDFISDMVAYQNYFFGKRPVGDNSSLIINALDDLSGSGDLISIRSRGNFKRPFLVVDKIKMEAEAETAEEETEINKQIEGFQRELQSILSSAKPGEEEVIGSSILEKKKELELNLHEAQKKLLKLKLERREKIEHLGNILRSFNMLMAPAVILIIAVVLGIRRSIKKRHYISHASDA